MIMIISFTVFLNTFSTRFSQKKKKVVNDNYPAWHISKRFQVVFDDSGNAFLDWHARLRWFFNNIMVYSLNMCAETVSIILIYVYVCIKRHENGIFSKIVKSNIFIYFCFASII